jgi:hypothetical protein
MTSDITVNNKTGTLSIFIAETLVDGNLAVFTTYGLHSEAYPAGISDRREVAPPHQANAISCAPGARTEWLIPVAARNALRGPSPVSKRPA